jgi:hypothetical protein
MYTNPQSPDNQIESWGDSAFLGEASNHGWSVFKPITPDVGIDYIIAKRHAAVMVQLKTAKVMDDKRYHVTVGRFLEGPFGYIIYYFQDHRAFFIVPTVDFWEIPRFKALKARAFDKGSYPDTMSYEKAKKVMGEYEGEKGWELLEQLTSCHVLLQVIMAFLAKKKRDKK